MINPFKKIEYNLRKLHRLRKNIELEKENFNEIILISESLQNNIKNFDSPCRFSFLLSKDSRKKLHKIQEIIHKISHEILTDLRTDLLIRLTEQQQSLKSAKSEVESHIK